MKKPASSLLPLVTIALLAFLAGFFWGRNANHQVVQLSVLPTQYQHDAPPATSSEEAAAFPINLNTARYEDLITLPGIGDVLARRILQYRQDNGPLERPEDLLNVEGLGFSKLESILNYVTTGG